LIQNSFRNFPYGFRLESDAIRLLIRLVICLFPATVPAQNRKALAELEGRIRHGIRNKEFPGAVMLVMHRGRVILKKGWGETARNSGIRPDPAKSVYDLASVTKGISTAVSLMKLYDEGKFSLDDSLGKFLSSSRQFPLGKLKIADLLAHRTGLPPYYISNYWLISKNRWDESSFSPFPTEKFPDPYRGLYLPKGYREQMLRDLSQLPFRPKPRTVYSDLNYILLGALVEALSGMRQDQFLENWLIKPMNLQATCYNPLVHGIPADRIIPSMANPAALGWVHDTEAGKLAGVCGAAGLFSTAAELAEIGEMLRCGGQYQGKTMLKEKNIKHFAWKIHSGYARGFGWQKPAGGMAKRSIAPAASSSSAFGHTGHTGSLLWVDPQKQLTVVFLANLTYPDDEPSVFTRKAGYRQILRLAYRLI
jgi:CubicO group peptidase (beta-lactamase class C family)